MPFYDCTAASSPGGRGGSTARAGDVRLARLLEVQADPPGQHRGVPESLDRPERRHAPRARIRVERVVDGLELRNPAQTALRLEDACAARAPPLGHLH